MFDQKGRKGIIYQKMRYGKRAKQIKDRVELIANKRTRMNETDSNGALEAENGNEAVQHSDSEHFDIDAFTELANALIKYLEKCKVPEHVPKIKKKFEETVELRKKMFLDLDEYKRLFELYLAWPQLVR